MKLRVLLAALVFAAAVTALGIYIAQHNIAVLEPKGEIGEKERQLMIIGTWLSALVVLPVFALTFFITWKYREKNHRGRYTPDWDGHRGLEALWWGIPCAIILILAVIAIQSSHSLDPFRPLAGKRPTLEVEVVALQWKWLFIYPEQKIATVNYLQLPNDTPVTFHITSDAPMNSFWIPQLGGQVYAMSGMDTHLNLRANHIGVYEGVSANLSGEGFAGMHFKTNVVEPTQFEDWAAASHGKTGTLDRDAYEQLAKPSADVKPTVYGTVSPGLYDTVIAKYTVPAGAASNEGAGEGTGHALSGY